MGDMKGWTRATQLTKEFPRDKYRFSECLKSVGDYVETYPMPEADARKVMFSAHAWAWYHGYRVSVERHNKPGGQIVRVTLTHKVRIRDYG